jgi:hypothetical protein
MDNATMHRVSRSGLEDFIKCPRCAYLKYAMDCWPPKSPPYTLNLAVDQLLKLEFDSCRQEGRHHPWTRELGLRPYNHPRLDEWRDEKRGLVRDCVESGVQLFGALDDLWCDDEGGIHVVDYKATKSRSAPAMNAPWHDSYRRQADMYQWMLRGLGVDVSPTAYFLFCVVDESRGFAGSLNFTHQVVPYEGSDGWIPGKLKEFRAAMAAPTMPSTTLADCDACRSRAALREAFIERGWR